MKCNKCGKEVALGDVYCSQCGTEIQIVPDYNVFGDDFSDVIQKKESNRNVEAEEAEVKKDKESKAKAAKKKNILILSISLGVIALIAIILIVSIFISSNKNKKSFNYHFSNAEEYYENGMLDDALQAVNNALKIDDDNVHAGLLKAEILAEKERYKDAIKVLKQIIETNPDNLKAYNYIIRYCVEISDFDTLMELAEEVEDDAVHSLFADYIAKTPTFSVKPGTYDEEIHLAITTNDEAVVYYTTDGTSPKNKGILYTGEITIAEGVTTIRAYATNEHGAISDEVEGTYIINVAMPSKPEVTIPSGTYSETQLIKIYVPVGWTAYYTWDGTIPDETSNIYTEPFEMIEGNNVLSIIFINNEDSLKQSEVAYYNYIFYPEETNANDVEKDDSTETNKEEKE